MVGDRCAKIVELLTTHACWECGIEFSCADHSSPADLEGEGEGEIDDEESASLTVQENDHSTTVSSREGRSQSSKYSKRTETILPFISSDDKQQLQRALPREVDLTSRLVTLTSSSSSPQTSITLLKLWTLVMSERHTVWDFVESLEQCLSVGALQLIGHKVDKKKERTISFAMKQVLPPPCSSQCRALKEFMDRLKAATTIEDSLPMICTLAVHQVTAVISSPPL
jgi:hypothetical protein